MNKYLIDLAWAFSQVNTRFYENTGIDENNHEYLQNLEHNFSSEIVRYFRNNMETGMNPTYYRGLVLDFDMNKQRAGIKPDLVLHNANNNRIRQEFYAEVKTNPNANLFDDIQKLVYAITELGFSYSIAIVVNKQFGNTTQQIRNIVLQNNLNTIVDRMYLFHAEITNGVPVFNLKNFRSL